MWHRLQIARLAKQEGFYARPDDIAFRLRARRMASGIRSLFPKIPILSHLRYRVSKWNARDELNRLTRKGLLHRYDDDVYLR